MTSNISTILHPFPELLAPGVLLTLPFARLVSLAFSISTVTARLFVVSDFNESPKRLRLPRSLHCTIIMCQAFSNECIFFLIQNTSVVASLSPPPSPPQYRAEIFKKQRVITKTVTISKDVRFSRKFSNFSRFKGKRTVTIHRGEKRQI